MNEKDKPRCGAPMRGGQKCGKADGHGGSHWTEAAYARARESTRNQNMQKRAVESVCTSKGCQNTAPIGDDECPDCHRERSREASRRYAATPEGREANRDRMRRYLATPEGRKAHAEATRRVNIKTGNAAGRRRRARLAGLAQEDLSTREIWERDDQRCYLCGDGLALKGVHVEHMIPVAHPSRALRRLRSACSACNLSKGVKLLAPYLLERQKASLPISAEYERCMAICPLFEQVL
jgi:5-methylcytosine-specific restriction endonuclease McrA